MILLVDDDRDEVAEAVFPAAEEVLVDANLRRPRVEPLASFELEMAKEYRFTFPLAVDIDWRTLKSWARDAQGHEVDTGWTSMTFVLDKKGIVRHVHPGGEYLNISRTLGGFRIAYIGTWLKIISYIGAGAYLADAFAGYLERLGGHLVATRKFDFAPTTGHLASTFIATRSITAI